MGTAPRRVSISQYAAVQDEADLVGDRRTAAGAVGGKLALVHLDQVLGLAAGAIDHVIEVFGRATVEIGDDEADVEAHRSCLDAGADATLKLQDFAL